MLPLIFPYTFHPNPVFERNNPGKTMLSLISTGAVAGIDKDIYENIYEPSASMFSEINNLYNYCRTIGDRNFLIHEIFSQKDEASAGTIADILRSGQNIYTFKEDDKIIHSGLLLKLHADYEAEHREIAAQLQAGKKKEKNLFDSILKTDPLPQGEIKKNESAGELPLIFLRQIIKSWLAIFIATGADSNLWVTDKKIYMELLEESGMEFIETEDFFLSEDRRIKYSQFVSKVTFGDFLEEKFFFIKNYNRKRKIFVKKIRLIFPG